MAKLSLLCLSIGLVVLFHGCVARPDQGGQQQQGECQIQSLNALEPINRIQAEAGETEFWDSNDQQFQCAGVAFMRHKIQPKGLLLPSYTNTPLLAYIIQGKGIQGILAPGCPETYQESQQEGQGQGQGQGQGEGSYQQQDRHQKVQRFGEGDIIAIPAGAAHWVYNQGSKDLIVVVFFDTNNNANQLDQNHRRFFIAGNQQQGQQQEGQQQEEFRNIFRGMDVKTLAEAFKVDEQTARKLQGEDDQRGHIVSVEGGLKVIRPRRSSQQEQQGQGQEQEQEQGQGGGNGLEETICSARFRENLDDPSRADIYNPRAGRFSSLNSFNLPILRFFKLSAERGSLRQNALMAPHWSLNSHNLIYGTNGDARIQIVDHRGQAVFNDKLQEGQVVVVPQNFAVVKQAGNQGFEWVGFRTNDNAMINTLAGRTSALRALPVDVIANAYQLPREEAHGLKFNRQETLLFSGSSRSQSGERLATA